MKRQFMFKLRAVIDDQVSLPAPIFPLHLAAQKKVCKFKVLEIKSFFSILFLFTLCVTLLDASKLSAANVVLRYDTEMGCGILLDGEILPGDLERLQEAERQYRELDDASKIFRDPKLCLNSRGGSFVEAIKIADYLLRWSGGISTAVARGAICESACALIFMAGRDTIYSSRYLHPSAKLGFHAPSIDKGSLSEGQYSREEIALSYAVALQSVARLVELQERKSWYLPTSLLTELLETPPEEMTYVETIGDAARWGIEIFPIRFPREFSSMSWAHACSNMIARFDDLELPAILSDEDGTMLSLNVDRSDFDKGIFAVDAGEGSECVYDFSVEISEHNLPNEFYFANNVTGSSAQLTYWKDSAFSLQMEVHAAEWMFLSSDIEIKNVEVGEPFWEAASEASISFVSYLKTKVSEMSSKYVRSCWLTSPTAGITNVNEYVNLRRQPDFSAPIVRRVPLDETVRLVQANSMWFIEAQPGRELCFEACQALEANLQDTTSAGRVRQCIDDNRLWYEISDTRGNRGWVSRKFLEEVE